MFWKNGIFEIFGISGIFVKFGIYIFFEFLQKIIKNLLSSLTKPFMSFVWGLQTRSMKDKANYPKKNNKIEPCKRPGLPAEGKNENKMQGITVQKRFLLFCLTTMLLQTYRDLCFPNFWFKFTAFFHLFLFWKQIFSFTFYWRTSWKPVLCTG